MIETYASFSEFPGATGFKIHNLGFKFHNLQKIYCPMKVIPDNLELALNGAIAMNIKGIGVSSPHKQSILKYLKYIDPVTVHVGACNTVINDNGILIGYNTDYYAISALLLDLGVKNIFICGNGGYSKTAQYVCDINDIGFSLINRSNWHTIDDIDPNTVIFNATPVIIDKPNVINASVSTISGKNLTLIQAAYQFSLYTDGLQLPMEECRKEIGLLS